jgi:hypothetical protein
MKGRGLALALACGMVVGVGSLLALAGEEGKGGAAKADVARQATALLDTKCFGCHNHGWHAEGSGPMNRSSWGQDVPRMVKEGLIVPGKPDESKLNKIVGSLTHPKSVPAKRPTAEEAKVFAEWIAKGTADPKAAAVSP